MPSGTYEHPLLGMVTFKTKSAQWVRGDPITFTSGFDPSTEVGEVEIPQLKAVKGANGGRVQFHRRAHAQLKAAFQEVEQQGLLSIIQEFGGFNPRLRKPADGSLSKLPSNHSFGLAVDINANDGTHGGSAAPLAPIFDKHGFLWGQAFHDPMHFEVRLFQPAMDTWAQLDQRRVAVSAPGLTELSAFISDQAKLFPQGLVNLDVQWSPDGGFHVRMDGHQGATQRPIVERPAGFAMFAAANRLTYDEVTKLVIANNRCKFSEVTTEILVSLIWKESGFDPAAKNAATTATGLMQVTAPAVTDVNKNTPSDVHYEHSDMTDPAKNIQCGSFYLGLRIARAGNKLKEGLEGYGTGSGYADDILGCAKCIKDGGAAADCLGAIHD